MPIEHFAVQVYLKLRHQLHKGKECNMEATELVQKLTGTGTAAE